MASPCPPPPTITTSYDGFGLRVRQRNSGWSPTHVGGADLVPQHADPVDLDLDDVAVLQRDLRVAEDADALGRAREDHVAALERDVRARCS